MLFALHLPGHTPGSTGFLARTTEGPKRMVGDASHTRWGWQNGVEPGTFTADHERKAQRLAWLRALAQCHPGLDVPLGHQRMDARSSFPGPAATRWEAHFAPPVFGWTAGVDRETMEDPCKRGVPHGP